MKDLVDIRGCTATLSICVDPIRDESTVDSLDTIIKDCRQLVLLHQTNDFLSIGIGHWIIRLDKRLSLNLYCPVDPLLDVLGAFDFNGDDLDPQRPGCLHGHV